MVIMGRIIHCTLATKYSWKGGKSKRQFCFFNGLLIAVICATRHTKHIDTMVSPDATEKDVITGIKEFLQEFQSIGRAKTWEAKQQNERNPDLHEHMSETEETSILNKSE
ncbi:uncharacterized protein LOC112452845 [Temnothorax curvispinosus]|uniref:Uncharacterized protein LOC112452845 n=1 Tax=Temnothorax curvispinosus TaxID=300111 RepID=A0A6J1PHH1_9HYME|nr:uncharacterized protein LOC112452845 [Temnothorax curvispinosus]